MGESGLDLLGDAQDVPAVLLTVEMVARVVGLGLLHVVQPKGDAPRGFGTIGPLAGDALVRTRLIADLPVVRLMYSTSVRTAGSVIARPRTARPAR